MDIHAIEPVTPNLSYDNAKYWNSEDSGYHTSFTSGSFESSKTSVDNYNHPIFNSQISFSGQFQVDCYNITKNISFSPVLQYNNGFSSNEVYNDSPQSRRGIKRSYQEENGNLSSGHCSIETPTSIISGDLRKLRFSDNNKVSFSSVKFGNKELPDIEISINEHTFPTYPTTPVKKICRSSCKINSPLNLKRPQRLNFVIHSLTCERQALQPIAAASKPKLNPKQFQYKPYQKIDIIKMLYLEANAMPPIMKIFSYLSNKDIFNFTLVSQLWQNVWEDVSKVKTKKQEYLHFLKNVKENQENKMATPKNYTTNQMRPLMEIHNILCNNQQTSSPLSPPGSPRTMRFKKYTKAALLDSRKQLPCVRCHQPAKVTEEVTGEEWLECTNQTCANQFCRFCKLERHPGKKCFQYDLDGPSPSKRKKNTCSIGTKKSRKNLRRLL